MNVRDMLAIVAAAVVAAASVAVAQEEGADHRLEVGCLRYGELPGARQASHRLDWWREARFGMFIHWGLYAIPAGEWGGKTTHGEWIRSSAQIPIGEYDKLVERFNPVKFDADAVVRAAKDAGMGYLVITTKHHDGFCLFDSALTDFDVMSTPFKRDVMKELADACRREGIKIGWYYSIMDWHHPDYLPRRDWEVDRPTDSADFERYVEYMKGQLRELLTNYGEIGVLWFDGQWEGSWNDERGRDLEAYVRSLCPAIIINSRVGRSGGDWGLDEEGGMLGDYATPEQTIPGVVPAGLDWETCMTMNDHWGYNRADTNFKSGEDLIRKLAEIAGKGGNFLLNIGPTAEGEIPAESVERLAEIGEWMRVHGESIRGTTAGVIKDLDWGFCTQRERDGQTRLYLHVIEPPADGVVMVPGLLSPPRRAHMLGDDGQRAMKIRQDGHNVMFTLPVPPPDPIDTVVAIDVDGRPDLFKAPEIQVESTIFVDSLDVQLTTDRERVEVVYTLDETKPKPDSPVATGPIRITKSTVVLAACVRDGRMVCPGAGIALKKVVPRAAVVVDGERLVSGPAFEYFEFENDIQALDEMHALKPVGTGAASVFDTSVSKREKRWGVRFTGLIRVPSDGVYWFATKSDDGSRLWIGDELVVDNDTPHSFRQRSGQVALAAGLHPITVSFFENWGGCDLKVLWKGPGVERQEIPAAALFRARE